MSPDPTPMPAPIPLPPEGAADGTPERPFRCYTSRRFEPLRITPRTPHRDRPDEDPLFEVKIVDNDYNTYQEVMDVSILALDVTLEEAYAIAWEVDHRGFCVVAHADRDEAEYIASVIRTIGIEVEVNRIVRFDA